MQSSSTLPFSPNSPPPPLPFAGPHCCSELAARKTPTPSNQRRELAECGRPRGRGKGRAQTTLSHSDDDGTPPWHQRVIRNLAFEEYYKEQGIVSPEEWDTFIEFLRKPLPATFRINSCSRFCLHIRSQLENEFSKSLQAEFVVGNEAEAIRPLPWYPDNLAWHANFCRKQLRKSQTLERFHEFLKVENEIGNITRQEAVSMIPPLLLDISPEHFVLDMCAAPGSKTYQMLEILNRFTKIGSLPKGLIVANDLDFKRSDVLIHKMKRMCTTNLIVTNHEAQTFPCILSESNHCDASVNGVPSDPKLKPLLFDRVLCDVPCSGDGTLRKSPNIWWRWKAGIANGLHGLQVHIAMRGISLLKVGGRMVYSTCSINPVENEAVVGEILRRCEGSVELVDISNVLPQLVRRPGLLKWKIRDKVSWFSSYKDVPEARRGGVVPSMFPSGGSFVKVASDDDCLGKHKTDSNNPIDGLRQAEWPFAEIAETSDFPLERCMRIMAHDQNGGAFFIAVFQKLATLPDTLQFERFSEADLETDLMDGPHMSPLESILCNSCDEQNPPRTKAPGSHDEEEDKRIFLIQSKWGGVDPVIFLKDESIINHIKTFYGISEAFQLSGHLVMRNADAKHVKRIYYVSKSVKNLLELNFQAEQQLKITYVGQKMFERKKSTEDPFAPLSFRICSEGLPVILPYITRQILCASPIDFKHLLQYKSRKFTEFVVIELGEKASKLMPGCCVIVLSIDSKFSANRPQVNESTIAIACWKGKVSLNVMASDDDCQELLQRLHSTRTP